jgi:hypothetical protein
MQQFLAVLSSFFHSSLLYTFSCHSSPPTNIIIISSIQPLGRFGRNQSPVRRPVWLWYTVF